MTEGPLDLTVPLNIAEIRAALATTGPQRTARPVPPADPSASVAAARPQEGRGGSRHAGPKRLGRIAAFVAVAAALSVGTAGALVMSNNSVSQSVSLPASGAIPVAPSTGTSQPGLGAIGSGSTSAPAAPGLSHSAADLDPIYDGQSTGPATSWPTGKQGKGGASATATIPLSSLSPSDPAGTGAAWQPLYQGDTGSKVQARETSNVQTALNDIGYLQPYPHKSYVLPQQYSGYAAGPDPSGYYGSATSDAIAQFQQNFNIPYSGSLGVCDLQTYQALMVVTATASPSQSATQ